MNIASRPVLLRRWCFYPHAKSGLRPGTKHPCKVGADSMELLVTPRHSSSQQNKKCPPMLFRSRFVGEATCRDNFPSIVMAPGLLGFLQGRRRSNDIKPMRSLRRRLHCVEQYSYLSVDSLGLRTRLQPARFSVTMAPSKWIAAVSTGYVPVGSCSGRRPRLHPNL